MRIMSASVIWVPTCQHDNVPKTCQFFNLACANVPKGVPIFQLRLPKGVTIFYLFFKGIFKFLNFSVMLNICIANFKNIWAIREKLSCETKNLKFDIWKILSSKENLINLKPLTMDHLGLIEHSCRKRKKTAAIRFLITISDLQLKQVTI